MLNDQDMGGSGAGAPKPEKYDAKHWRLVCQEMLAGMQPFLDLSEVIERRLVKSKLWFCSRDADGKWEPGSIDMVAELAFSALHSKAKTAVMSALIGAERFAQFERDKEAATSDAEKTMIATRFATEATADLYNGELPFVLKSEDLAEIFQALKDALGKGGPK